VTTQFQLINIIIIIIIIIINIFILRFSRSGQWWKAAGNIFGTLIRIRIGLLLNTSQQRHCLCQC